MEWQAFLASLQTSAGISAAVGVALSIIIEYIPRYEDLEPKAKRLVFLGICVVVGLVAAGVSVALDYQEFGWEATFWPALVAAVTAFASGTVAHTRKL